MTNKKKVKSAAKSPKASKEATASVPVPAPVGAPAKRSGLSPAQFSGLIFLSVGMTYLLEFRHVMNSKACNEYLLDYSDKCTHSDLVMVQTKFNSGILTELLVALCMLLCWTDESLFHRLNFAICSSPLITTLIAMRTAKDVLHPGHGSKLGMLVTVLLVVAATSIYASSHIATRRPLTVDLQNTALVVVAVVHGWEVYKFLSAGVGGYLRVTEVSPPSIALLPFLAVDQCTVVGLCFFGIAFLDDAKKRTFLLFFAMCQFAAHIFMFPFVRDSVLDANYYDNFYFGTAAFSFVSSVAPEVTFLKEQTYEDESLRKEV